MVQWTPETIKWVGAASFYAIVSFGITAVNKSVLSIYKFPSIQFMTLVQLIATIALLPLLKYKKLVNYPDWSTEAIKNVMPLPIIYLLNIAIGLGSTQSLSIPMFTVLRRFCLLFTMIGEMIILKKKFSLSTAFTVFIMLFGALIASVGDLAFEFYGYALVTFNNLITAAQSIYIKKIDDKQQLGKFGMMYYNSLCAIPFSFLALSYMGEYGSVMSFEGWSDPFFCAQFILVEMMGILLVLSTILVASVCGPLTHMVIGLLKSAVMTYFGMWFGGDYVFSYLNFFGITLSALGAIAYSVVSFKEVEKAKTTPISNESKTVEKV